MSLLLRVTASCREQCPKAALASNAAAARNGLTKGDAHTCTAAYYSTAQHQRHLLLRLLVVRAARKLHEHCCMQLWLEQGSAFRLSAGLQLNQSNSGAAK